MTGKCQTCGCYCELTKHHLVPVSKCKNKYKQVKENSTNHIWICRQCHDAIHASYSEQELRDLYSTLDSLLSAPEFAKFVAWKKKHPEFDGHSKMSNRRR